MIKYIMTLNQKYQPTSQRKGTGKRKNKIVLMVMISFIVMFIAKKEIPLIDNSIDRLIAPEKTKANQTCHRQAIRLGQKPDFARIIQQGQVIETHQGFLVSQIIIGEMGNDGHEIRFNVTCYTNSHGELVRAEIITTSK